MNIYRAAVVVKCKKSDYRSSKAKTFSKSFLGVGSFSTSGFERHIYFSRAELDWWTRLAGLNFLQFCYLFKPPFSAFILFSDWFQFIWKSTNIYKLTCGIDVADHRSAECTGNVLCFVRVQDRRDWNHLQQIPAHVLCSKEETLWSFGPQEARVWSRFLWIQAAYQWYRGLQIVKYFCTAILM